MLGIRRREFIRCLGSAAIWPIAAGAQQTALRVVGFLDSGSRDNFAVAAFRDGMRQVGFIEGENVAIEYRWAENKNDRLPGFAAELVRRGVAVIAAGPGPSSISAARAATRTTPIVFMSAPDPVRMGLVASLNHPGGNLTGVTLLSADLTAKRLGLLHELVPQVTTIAMLLDGNTQTGSPEFQLREAESAASTIGVRVLGLWVSSEEDLEEAFATAVREGSGALLVSASILLMNLRDRLVALAAKYRLPAMYHLREFVALGGVMSYGPSASDLYRQVGIYTGRILNGEKPSDLPVLQPTKYEFVLNLTTIKEFGVLIPPGVRAIADEVIE